MPVQPRNSQLSCLVRSHHFRSLTKKLILNDSVAECGKHVGDMFISRYFVCLEVSLLAEESQNIQNSLANENFKQRSQYSLKQKTKKKHSDLSEFLTACIPLTACHRFLSVCLLQWTLQYYFLQYAVNFSLSLFR